MPGGILNAAKFGTDCRKITPEFTRMLPSVLSHFLNNWIFHLSTSNNSSGEQTSGHSYPSPSMTFLIVLRLNGSLRWPIFQDDDGSRSLQSSNDESIFIRDMILKDL
jgi:hypothetical protein